MPMGPSITTAEPAAADVSEWRQGDYTLAIRDFIVSDAFVDGALEPVYDPVPGVAVVTQTCDIVNNAPGKEYVVVCPLKELTEASMAEVAAGRSPAGATLEHPPTPTTVVDFGRMMSIHKSMLAGFTRVGGFTDDARRSEFAAALERKHGRFAFPDAFSDGVLSPLRSRIGRAHGKAVSEHGSSYRSILTARATAHPDWDADEVEVTFLFALARDRAVARQAVARTLDDHLGRIAWPKGFKRAEPPYLLRTLEEFSAAEWLASRPIDWDFISAAGKAVA